MNPQSPDETIPTPLDTPTNPVSPKSSPNIAVIALSAFILFALGAVAFLFYQNQQLKTLLATYQAPASSPTPIATTDPTASWNEYVNTKYGYSLKYPPNWHTQVQAAGAGNIEADSNSSIIDIYKTGEDIEYPLYRLSIEPFEIIEGLTIKSITDPYLKYNLISPKESSTRINGIDIITVEGKIPESEDQISFYSKVYVIKFPQKDSGVTILTRDDTERNETTTIDQILSTFKFTETSIANPTLEPVACTMEAKICPDGSSVGRAGPKCDFAPCPTP